MARPFGQNKDQKNQNGGNKVEKQSTHLENSAKRNQSNHSEDSIAGASSSSFASRNLPNTHTSGGITNSCCIADSSVMNSGHIFVNTKINESTASKNVSPCSEVKSDVGRRIKVRKGIFASNRLITEKDIEIVSEVIQNDWKMLLKKLPGVTVNNTSYHQAFIDNMDRNTTTNMAEIALCTWRSVLPEFSTVGNLSKTLFSIGHPDIVTYLKP